jgi:hypothetical protein
VPLQLKPKDEVTSEYVQAHRAGICIRTPLENVTHFQAEDKYVTAFTQTHGEFTLNLPLWLITRILKDRATAVHRSYLVMNPTLKGAKMFKPAGADQWVFEVLSSMRHGDARAVVPRIIRVARREAKRVRALWKKANA